MATRSGWSSVPGCDMAFRLLKAHPEARAEATRVGAAGNGGGGRSHPCRGGAVPAVRTGGTPEQGRSGGELTPGWTSTDPALAPLIVVSQKAPHPPPAVIAREPGHRPAR